MRRRLSADPLAAVPPVVLASLEDARVRGFLGDVPLGAHLEHAAAFAGAAQAGGLADVPGRMLDLGSGGGIPGLMLATMWPDTAVVLLDSSERRCEALRQVVARSGWQHRVQVVRARAEDAGRDPALRASFDLVVARSFGPPAVVAECAAPFLCLHGLLVVSEPPLADADAPVPGGTGAGGVAHPRRWPVEELNVLGLRVVCFHRGKFGFQVLEQSTPCPDRFPRRAGVPARRPLYPSE
jgi:16S rRNA (guanine527-N7)-methyltransferase